MSKINVSILNKLDDIEDTKGTGKSCVIQQIIERFPEEHVERVTEIIESRDLYTTSGALKVLRKVGIKNGSEDSLKKHRRKSCICYI